MQKSKATNLMGNSLWVLLERVINLLCSFVVIFAIANSTRAEYLGEFTFMMAVLALVAPLAQFGIGRQVLGELSVAPDNSNAIVHTAMLLRLVLSALVALTSWLLFYIFYGDAYSVLAFSILLMGQFFSFLEVCELGLIFKERFRLVAQLKITISLLFLGAKLFIVLNKLPLVYLLSVISIETVLKLFSFAYFYLSRTGIVAKVDFKVAKRLLNRSLYLALSGFAATIYLKIDVLMLEHMANTKLIGFYSIAVKLSEASIFIAVALCSVAGPAIIKLYTNDQLRYNTQIKRSFGRLILYSSTICVFWLTFASFIFALFFPKEFNISAQTLQILTLALPFLFVRQLISYVIIAIDYSAFSLISHSAGALTNVLLNFFLIPEYGIQGAALASVISYSLSGYFSLLFTRKTREYFFIINTSILTIPNIVLSDLKLLRIKP